MGTLVRWVVSQVPIVYPNRLWFADWSARLLLYTPTDPGSLGGQPGSYYIPQPTLVRWVVSQVPIVYPNRLWFVGWSPNEPGSVGVYNRSLADHPANQGRLEYTIGAWLTTQRARVGWGIQKEPG